MDTLTVLVGQQLDGCTFQLDPTTRRALAQQGAEPGAKSLFVAREARDSFDQTWRPLARHIVGMLSGWGDELLGNTRAVFVEPGSGEELMGVDFEPSPRASHG